MGFIKERKGFIMCGIVGYIGNGLGVPKILRCLSALEYRGYDSAGVAYLDNEELYVQKRVGKLQNLSSYLKNKIIPSSCAIGHTRWATHGEPNKVNAHPQIDNNSIIALVHNGIIENYNKIKQDLNSKGIEFKSETDTEAFAQLLSYKLFAKSSNANMRNTLHTTKNLSKKQILRAISESISSCEGAFAFAILIKGFEDCIFFAKNKSPLIIGKGIEENFLASDMPALLGCADKFYSIKDGELGYIEKNKVYVCDENLHILKPQFNNIEIKPEQVMLGEYEHFMHKEIEQGAKSILDTIERIKKQKVLEKISPKVFKEKFNLHITACGTALHAGMIAKYLIENQLRIPVDLDYASEFRYKKPIINSNSICLFISQSGETADTLSCIELAKELGATTIAFTNVPASRMEQIVDFVIPTSAGPEIAVASTKAYLAQLAAIYVFVEYVASILNKPIQFNVNHLKTLVLKYANTDYFNQLNDVVDTIKNEESIYFIGRGLDYLLALEGALKLKEISYIHCEALPAGELKHGSLALIQKNSIVIAILTQSYLIEKTLNNIHELNSRGAKIILISPFKELESFVYHQIVVPKVENILSPFVAIKPLQMLAYKTSIVKNLDPDKPRNLAKSVTVE